MIGSRDNPKRPCCHGVCAPLGIREEMDSCGAINCCPFLRPFRWICRQNALKIPEKEGFLLLGRIKVSCGVIISISSCDFSNNELSIRIAFRTRFLSTNELVFSVNCSKLTYFFCFCFHLLKVPCKSFRGKSSFFFMNTFLISQPAIILLNFEPSCPSD